VSFLIILLLPVPIVGWGFFLLADRYGIRNAYNILAAIVLGVTTITLVREHGFSGFLVMETALVAPFLLVGGVALTVTTYWRNGPWRRLLPATGAVGLSLAVICVEMYRIVLNLSAP
jgi:hypothetical protein